MADERKDYEEGDEMHTKAIGCYIPGLILLATAACSAACAQDWPPTSTNGMPTKVEDITQPGAAPIPLLPQHISRTLTAADEKYGGIMWGSGPTVQAGVRVRFVGDGTHPSRYLFDVYLRNKTSRAQEVDCSGYTGNPVPAGEAKSAGETASGIVPIVRDAHGVTIDMGLGSAQAEHRFNLAPAEVAHISHWVVFATENKLPPVSGSSEIGYLAPGNYRIRCGVNVRLNEQQETLNTSNVSFRVLEADAAPVEPKKKS